MKIQLHPFITLSLIILLLSWITTPVMAADEHYNPHALELPLPGKVERCLACHKQQPVDKPGSGRYSIPVMDQFKQDATRMCTHCHNSENVSHVVGASPAYRIPADLPLDRNRRISCLTCHYAHGDLNSNRPMASTSFMDRLFEREKLHKSYLLRRNNADGDLCLACHNQ